MSKKYHRRKDAQGNEYFVEEASKTEKANEFGKSLMSCGCLIMILVPIILFLLMFL